MYLNIQKQERKNIFQEVNDGRSGNGNIKNRNEDDDREVLRDTITFFEKYKTQDQTGLSATEK